MAATAAVAVAVAVAATGSRDSHEDTKINARLSAPDNPETLDSTKPHKP